jgi:pyruvate,orthophosphate dikinase
MNDIPYEWGTAVNVQPMVFGNLNNNSATGVAFTRNPATGEAKLFGEYLINAQGEDVVAGVRTPSEISQLAKEMPEVYQQFVQIAQKLEDHYKDMQDMEFTIENGKFYMLQTRNGKRTAAAALKIAVDLVAEGKISEKDAVLRIEPKQLDDLLHPTFDPAALKDATEIGQGLAASPGAAVGQIVFSAEDAKVWADQKKQVILARLETSPEDIEGMAVSQGILTVRGGMTSHAAVVARGMGECCVSGCEEIDMHAEQKYFNLRGKKYQEGDWISLDGSTGKVYQGQITKIEASISGDFLKLMKWADDNRQMKVRTNADTPHDAAQAIEFGAEGIGLCRTEHMFFEADRIKAMREMILADSVEEREMALEKLLPMQQKDFEEIYEALQGRPATIRYLDPPLHEFLPTRNFEVIDLADEMGTTVERLKAKISSLHEFNPMLGHRGSRLAVSFPEIARMQTRAVIQAAININRKHPDWKIEPEIMLPLIGDVREFDFVRDIVVEVADQIIAKAGVELPYLVGTMVEVPRACLLADEIGAHASFFSFGTNDLTQMTYGFSRDDAGKFLDDYYTNKVFESDPFAKLDQKGVGQLMKMAISKGREANPSIKLGICGEHGGDPSSVEFCYNIGLDYVSCSPFRVPIARLAAAQASIKNPRK